MSLEHLSDEQLQICLEKKSNNHPEWDSHLKHCSQCQDKLKSYAVLFEGLSRQDETLLPDNFTMKLMSKIEKEPNSSFNPGYFFLSLMGVVTSIGAVIYLVGFKDILQWVTTTISSLNASELKLYFEIHKVFSLHGNILMILICAGLILVGVELLDKYLKKEHPGKISMFSA